jgi:hypothetical protein
MKEKSIAGSITKWLKTLPDTLAWKVTDHNNVGFPDIVGCHKGYAFFFEVKTLSGRATDKQLYEGSRIISVGGRFAIVTSLDYAKAFMDAWFLVDGVDVKDTFEKIRKSRQPWLEMRHEVGIKYTEKARKAACTGTKVLKTRLDDGQSALKKE